MGLNTTLNNCANITTITWSEGLHTVIVWANDTLGNENSSEVTFTIDSLPPSVTALTETPDPATYLPGQTYQINATVTDPNIQTVILEFNGTNYTASNLTGFIYNVTFYDLAAGTYEYRWIANDSYGNINDSENDTYTISKATQNLNLDSSPSWSETYNTTTTITGSNCPSPLACSLYRNGSSVTNGVSVTLGAGNYNYTYNTTGNQNYTAASNSSLLTIAQRIPQGALNSTADWSIEAGTQITVGYDENNTGDEDLTYIIYRNGTNIGSGETWTPATGSHEYILNTTGGENYTKNESMDSQILVVEDTTPPSVTALTETPDPAIYLPGQIYQINATVTDPNIQTVILEFNGTNYTASNLTGFIYNVTFYDLAAGTYEYRWIANDSYGNINDSENDTYTISKATQNLNLDSSPSWSETYNTTTTITGSNCPSQLNCILYRNGTSVTNGASVTLGAGNYNYTYNTTGNQNYTVASNSSLLTIAKRIPQGALNSTADWSIEAGTQITVGYDENNTGDEDLTYIIYRNGTNIGSGETWTPATGSHEYILNTTGGENYTKNESMDSQILVVADTTPPSVTLLTPKNYQNLSNPSIDFNCSISDIGIGLKNSTLYGNFSGIWTANESKTITGGTNSTNFTITLTEGTYIWNCYACDQYGNCGFNNTNNTLTLDTTEPTIRIDGPINNTWQQSQSVTFQYTPVDKYLKNCTLYGNFNRSWLANQTNTTATSDSQDSITLNLSNGTYLWNVECYDYAGNNAFNTTNYTINVDSIEPSVSLDNPDPGFSTSNPNIDFQFTVIDNLDASLICNLTINGTVNESNIPATNNSQVTQPVLGFPDGTYYWNVTCWDNASNINTSLTRNFTIDSAVLSIVLNYPQNDSWQQSQGITFNYTVTGDNIDACVLYGDFSGSWLKNETNSSPNDGVPIIVNLDLTNGTYIWNAECNKTTGSPKWADENYTFHVDSVEPGITLNYPVTNYNTTNTYIDFNWTVIDNLDSNLICNLTINGTVNVSNIESSNGTFTNQTVDGFTDGTYYWNITCIDNALNVNTSETKRFTIDTLGPIVKLDAPSNNTWQSSQSVTFQYTPTNSNLKNCTLYGDFTGTWEANATNTSPTSGSQDSITLNLTQHLIQLITQ
jgi:hypothetical protein